MKSWRGPDLERLVETRGTGISRFGGWIRVAGRRGDVRRNPQNNVGEANSCGWPQPHSAGDELPARACRREENSGGDRDRRKNVREAARYLRRGRALPKRSAQGPWSGPQ